MSSPVNLAQLPDYLRKQRWFAGKAWPIKHVSVLDHVVVPRAEGEPFVLAVVEVTYELGNPEWYALPVVHHADGNHDALEEDASVRALSELVRTGGRIPSASGQLVGEALEVDGKGLPKDPPIRRLSVEQSNTSVVLGETAILKVIRKLQPGANPEYEVGRFLSTRTKFRAMPALLGALHLESQGGLTVGVVHAFVAGATDGWKVALHLLQNKLLDDPLHIGHIRDLGRVVGELHRCLASDAEDPAFSPVDIHVDDMQSWSSSLIGELGVTLAQAQAVEPRVAGRRDALVERLKRLAHAPPGGQRIRVHGDLHLGQVLWAEDRWLVFDFEGEPGRTFQQRREKTTALKDVAGMLRSFAYAAASVGLPEAERKRLGRTVRRAFLDGYREATAGAAFLPGNPETFDALLDAFELEKALYEVRYELTNRPDWVSIPLEALLHDEEGESR
jgi:trehalose synthase-fused probable maltokinase